MKKQILKGGQSKMRNIRQNSGITLIALVITIIVLLILAGVVIASLTGENSILNRAADAKSKTERQNIIEQAQLAVLNAEVQANGRELTESELKDVLRPYFSNVDDIKLTDPSNEDETLKPIATGTEKWDVITVKEVLGTATASNNNNNNNNNTTGSKPTVADIGKEVAYGVDLDGNSATNDWKIFYATDSGTYIIASDYLNNSLLPSATNMGTYSGRPYSAYWPSTSNLTRAGASAIDTEIAGANKTFELSWLNDNSSSTNNNAKAVAALLDTSAWSTFANGISGAYAVGGPTLELYTASWNAKGYTKLYTDYNSTGYYVGVEASPSSYASENNAAKGGYYVNMSSVDTAGYGDKLYYPHQSAESNCYGYWLASPSAGGGSIVMLVNYDGYVSFSCYDDRYCGVRPVVYLPSNVQLTEDNEVWTVES